ncbi:MAG: DUF1697 domain-containing protein [Chloroflexota bacterium]
MGTSTRHIALLRGINVGGKNRLPMADLKAMFARAGCEAASTYVQSGNVVFEADAALASRIPATIQGEIESRCGLSVPVLIRTAEELSRAAANNPFLAEGDDPADLHLVFLADTPSADAAGSLDPERSPPDRFALHGREVYLKCPNGLGRSKLTTGYFDSKLRTVSTIRNWRTVQALLAMSESSC